MLRGVLYPARYGVRRPARAPVGLTLSRHTPRAHHCRSVSGQLDPSDPSCKVGYYTDTSAMYNKLCKAGVLKMFDCAQSHTAEDTLCFGEYLI